MTRHKLSMMIDTVTIWAGILSSIGAASALLYIAATI